MFDNKNILLMFTQRRAFTLIEVLLVIGILSTLLSIVIIAINPAKQFKDARDAERLVDVYSILTSLHQYAAEHDGTFPDVITTTATEICVTSASTCTSLVDLSTLTDDGRYAVEMPRDPLCDYDTSVCTENGTGYEVMETESGRITVRALHAENATTSVTR